MPLEDLWEYTATGWTLQNGPLSPTGANATYSALATPQPSNSPGGLMWATSWSDPHGNLWLFGGANGPGGTLSNLTWEYAPDRKEWIWIGGPGGNPGARYGAAAYAFGFGDFVLFGGRDSMDQYHNDSWNGRGVIYDW
jgi:hypothetical protein